MKRLAKLKSDIVEIGNAYVIYVEDDEIEGKNKTIMWVNIQTKQDGDKEYLFVPSVDYNDELYYEMPQQRQDRCGTVIFKKFLSFYNQNYGKNTGNWLPVGAEFANYDLQEKFKEAIDKGIFPKESLKYCTFISKEEWDKNDYYNKKNRDKINDFIKNPEKYLNGVTVNDACIINPAFSIIPRMMDNMHKEFNLVEKGYPFYELSCNIIDNEIKIDVPGLSNFKETINNNFTFLYKYLDNEIEFINLNNIEEVKKILLENKDITKQCIDTNPKVTCSSTESFRLNELFIANDTIASNRYRLVKKSRK